MSFNGESSVSCPQTPCKAEFREGDVRIIATLEQYKTTDTTVSITANSQAIMMRLKPNIIYGDYEEAKPAKQSHTMLALALDIAGVVLISAGMVANSNAQDALDRYGKRGQPQAHYNEAWEDMKSNRSARNVRYVVGGIFLASGIGVHICF